VKKLLENIEEVFAEVDKITTEEIMELMSVVIDINTTVPPGHNYQELVNALKPYFKEIGYDLEEVIVPEELVKEIPLPLEGPRVNLVATKNYGQDKDISFYGHMDVVPAPDDGKDKWSSDPFKATKKGRKIVGRGTSDMKGAFVPLIFALQIIEKFNLKPKYNISVLVCTDEEIGVWPGIRYLKEKGYVKGDVFCMEGVLNPIIPIGAAGALNVYVETIGRSCHSGMNFMGVNALEEMVPIIDELMVLKKVVEDRESKDIPGFPRFGTGERRNMSPMFNLDVIRSGEKANIVPDSCKLTVNRRYIPDEKYEDVKREIEEAIERGKAKSKAIDVKVIYMRDYPPIHIDPDSPMTQRIKKVMNIVQKVNIEDIAVIGMSGSTDMGFLADTHDLIIHGVGNPGSKSHAVNESIKLNDVRVFTKEIILFLCGDL